MKIFNKAPADGFWALKDVSFEVEQGEVVGIIGRNGAGKSTLLKILSRITSPTEGTVELRGRVGSLLEVGTGFHPELTGRENIYLSGSILGMKRSEINAKLDEIVKFSEIEKFLDTPVKRYSSGMYVRLAFAVAAHLQPEILLVDEVLAVGDAAFQKKCLGKMGDVAKEGRTVLFVSHNMSAITTLCKRVLLIDYGQIIIDDKADVAVSKYIDSSLGMYGRNQWDNLESAPGKNGFKLLSVEIINEDGTPLKVVNVEKPVLVRVRYLTQIPQLKFRIALSLYCGATCAFASVEPSETLRMEAGQYYSEMMIPRNFLAERDYSINLSVFSSSGSKIHYCQIANVIVFQTYDPMTGNSARGDYTQGLEGVVRPLLLWQTFFENKII